MTRGKTLAVLLLVAAVAASASFVAYAHQPHIVIARILDARAVSSMRDTFCVDWSFTDANVDCGFAVAPAEFPHLLAGHRFARRQVSGPSAALPAPLVGPAFATAEEYSTTLRDEPHGGSITLWTDREHRHVRLSYWAE